MIRSILEHRLFDWQNRCFGSCHTFFFREGQPRSVRQSAGQRSLCNSVKPGFGFIVQKLAPFVRFCHEVKIFVNARELGHERFTQGSFITASNDRL